MTIQAVGSRTVPSRSGDEHAVSEVRVNGSAPGLSLGGWDSVVPFSSLEPDPLSQMEV